MEVVNKPPENPSQPTSATSSGERPATRDVSDASGSTPRPVDFVSEDDVRAALKKGRKIYVGPRTIITPSAHDLGDPHEIFVVTS